MTMELIPPGDDLKHWGSYDAVDHGFDARTQGPVGRAQRRAALGTVVQPPINPMGMLSVPGATEVRGNLRYVNSALQPSFLNALAPTEFIPQGPPQQGYQQGTIRLSASTAGPAWYNDAVQNGAAVLLDTESIALAEPRFFISADPAFIGSRARANGGPAAIVAIPAALEAQAQAAVPQPIPGPPPVPGPPPQPGAASTAVPWVPLAIGTAVLVGVGVLVFRKK